MHDELLAMVSAARRRVITAACARLAIVCATGGALAASCMLGAFQTAYAHPLPAAALAMMPALAGAIILLFAGFWRMRRRVAPAARAGGGLRAQMHWPLQAVLLILGGLAGGAIVLGGRWVTVDPWLAAAATVLAFAAVGAITQLLRRPSLFQVAAEIDRRLALKERLATAVELILRAGRWQAADGAESQAIAAGGGESQAFAGTRSEELSALVVRQAVGAAKQAGVERLSFAQGLRQAAAACGLAMLLCLAVAAIPSRGPEQVAGQLTAAADAFDRMTPEQKKQLARQLLEAARNAKDAGQAQHLDMAAGAAAEDDPQLLAEAMRRLAEEIRRGNIELARGMDFKIDGVEKVQDSVEPNGVDHAFAPKDNAPADNFNADPGRLNNEPVEASLYVFAPKSPAAPGNAPADPAATAAGYKSFDRTWDQARAAAGESLGADQVPPAYQQLVRDFFAQ